MRKTIFALLLLALSPIALAQAEPYQEGVHYFRITQPSPQLDPGKVTVNEAFSYLCNHCATFDPYLQSWQTRQPAEVQFSRLPVEFDRATWGLYARAYVTAAVLGVAEQAHVSLMDTLWKERKQMRNMEELAGFYSTFGIEPERFIATAKSFAVDMRLRQEQQLLRQYEVSSTPSMVVNGKYRVTAGGSVGDFDVMLKVVDFLVARELGSATN